VTADAVDDRLLYRIHLLLNPFVESEVEPPLAELAAEFGVAPTPKAIVSEAVRRFAQAGETLVARHLSGWLCQLNCDMAGYRREASALIQEAGGTLVGACVGVSVSHQTVERVRVFRNSDEQPGGLQQALELALETAGPDPDYTNRAGR